MSSIGSAVGGVVGAIAGFFLGGPTGALYGAQIGSSVGGLIDPPKGPNVKGPRLDDLSVQTSTYGANIPRLYGTAPVVGNIFWLEKDKIREKKKKKKSGGKGGGGSTVTTYTYFATFAVGLCAGPIVGIRRLWLGPNLVYDSAAATTAGVIQSGKSKSSWKLYLGSDDQTPDPRIQADKGVNSASAHPGLAYLVFYDLPLEKYGNSLAGVQVKAEVVTAGSAAWGTVGSMTMTGLYSTNPVFTGFCSYFTTQGGYYFEPLWNNSYNQWPYTLRVWYIGVDLSKKLIGTVSTGVSSGYAITCCASMDIPAAVVRFELGAPGYSFAIVNKDGTVKFFSLPSGSGFSQILVRKLGDDVIATSYINTTPRVPVYRYSYSTGVLEAVSASPVNVYVAIDVFGGDVYAVDSTGAISILSKESLTITSSIPAPSGFTVPASARLVVTSANSLFLASDAKYWKYESGAWTLLFTAADGYESQKALFVIGETLVSAEDEVTAIYAKTLSQTTVQLSAVVQTECLQSNLLTAADLDVAGLAADTVRGYRIADTASIRSGLEPLQAIWPFDVRTHGYQLEFLRRGSSPVAAIPAQDLDARFGGAEPGPLLTVPREMDTQLPRKSILRYLDVNREYDIGEQSAQRYNTDAVNTSELEVAVALTATEAVRAVEVLHYTWWRERSADIRFNLPPSYLNLEPGDVVTVTDSGATVHTLRLTAIHYTSDGILECTARREDYAAYSSAAVADSGQSTGAGIVIEGPSLAVPLDIPPLTSSADIPGFYAGMTGLLSGWPGGILYGSYDAGQNWDDLEAFDNDSVIGTVAIALGTPTCFNQIDATGTLTVALYAGEIVSITESEMLAGGNHFAYGVHGRWEILAARTATLNGDGTYTLQDFVRGRFGTEQYATVHAADDLLIQLTSSETAFIAREAGFIDVPAVLRAVTFGSDLEEVGDENFTYTGENLMPRSPVALNGNRHPTTNDWTLTWIRRARIDTEWRNYVDVPLDEVTESYEVEVYSSGTYATLKRTITGLTSATAVYTSAQQVTDFGSNQATLYLKIYQLSATVGRGWPLITSIVR